MSRTAKPAKAKPTKGKAKTAAKGRIAVPRHSNALQREMFRPDKEPGKKPDKSPGKKPDKKQSKLASKVRARALPKNLPKSSRKGARPTRLPRRAAALTNGFAAPQLPAVALGFDALSAVPPAALGLLNRLAQLSAQAGAARFAQAWRLGAQQPPREVWFQLSAQETQAGQGELRLWVDMALLNHFLRPQLAPWRGEELEDGMLELALQLALPEALQLDGVKLQRRKPHELPPRPLIFRPFLHHAVQGAALVEASQAARLERLLAALQPHAPNLYARALRVRVPIFCGRARLSADEIRALSKGDIVFLTSL